MTALFVYVGAALVVAIAGVALSSRYRSYDTAVRPRTLAGPPTVMIPTPEEATRVQLADSHVSDDADDLLDPRNPGHDQWLAAHVDPEEPPDGA